MNPTDHRPHTKSFVGRDGAGGEEPPHIHTYTKNPMSAHDSVWNHLDTFGSHTSESIAG